MFNKLIGDKRFYRHVFTLMIPILIQNGITNFVNMLDNLMVGQVGQTEMIGVSVANQLIFVFNLCIFGAVSGAGIFGAQFFGNNDHKGLRDSFRFKIIFCTLLTVGVIGLFYFCGPMLINMYLKGEGSVEAATASLEAGFSYLKIMLIGLIPAALAQCWSSTLRETGQTLPPMVAGVIAVFVNLTGIFIEVSVTYFLGRFLGKDAVYKMLSKKETGRKLLAKDIQSKTSVLVSIRAIPAFPIDFVSLFYGASGCKYLKYAVLSVAGIAWRVILFTLLGDAIFKWIPLDKIILIAICCIPIGVVYYLIKKFRIEPKKAQENKTDGCE